ncbi:MAG: hypothetical protein NT003_01845 [Candidatus Magasanikbacteria bacterium]|nr:hypothetical protein [Candidatus Magasanikbacteria bacterium]
MSKQKIKSGILTTLGFLLSPLSWWNDIFINIPIAYIFALPFGLISQKFFLPAMIFGYWLTNIAGFILMHHGVKGIKSSVIKKYSKKELIKDIGASIAYTILVVILAKVGLIVFPAGLFTRA